MKQKETGKIYFFDFTKTIGVEIVSGNNIQHDFLRHTHRNVCLGIVKEGKRSLICQDSQYQIVRGNIFVIPPKTSHSFNSSEAECSYSLFMVSRKLLQMILPSKNYKFNKVVLENNDYYEKILELEQLLLSKESEFLKQSMLVKVLGDIINECTLFIEPITMQYQQKEAVQKVKSYIDKHYKKNFTLGALAKIACLSPYYFLRVFTQIIGIPPHLYQQQVRIRAAKEMLLQGNNIEGIANTLGFSDQSHFSNAFKKMMGITPRSYMKDSAK